MTLRNAVNCYSESEDIVGNPKEPTVSLSWTDWALQQSSWVTQEALKGASVLDGINILPGSHIGCEGGWGRSAHYVVKPLAYLPGHGFVKSYFEDYTRQQLIEKPLFTSFNDTRMASTNALNIVDYRLRAKMLCDAIPAESFAAGANYTNGLADNYSYDVPRDQPFANH